MAIWFRPLGSAVEPSVENPVANLPYTGGKLGRPELGMFFQQGQDIGEIMLSLARPPLWLPGSRQLERDQIFRCCDPQQQPIGEHHAFCTGDRLCDSKHAAYPPARARSP